MGKGVRFKLLVKLLAYSVKLGTKNLGVILFSIELGRGCYGIVCHLKNNNLIITYSVAL